MIVPMRINCACEPHCLDRIAIVANGASVGLVAGIITWMGFADKRLTGEAAAIAAIATMIIRANDSPRSLFSIELIGQRFFEFFSFSFIMSAAAGLPTTIINKTIDVDLYVTGALAGAIIALHMLSIRRTAQAQQMEVQPQLNQVEAIT